MYIKQLVVHGFKSYRDETVFGPFSPQHNVIVGRNGSGKSNFFAAIRFVLHDAYSKLGQEERQALLHEGGSVHLSAYVEIVFDNAEMRFPTGKETTTIRRTVGLKKDEYSVDGKVSTKADVLNLLQSAGFSKSNPYYIVPQGRVTALTNARDAERLALLKEVAGTRTYEEHRQESLKILEETASKRQKITELLLFIEERMSELEEERVELRAYQEREKERRTVEYILQHCELASVTEELDRLETENSELVDENAATITAFNEQLARISEFEGQLEEMKRVLRETEDEMSADDAEKAALLKSESALQLVIEELEKQVVKHSTGESAITAMLEKLGAEIAQKEALLAEQSPVLAEHRKLQQTHASELTRLEGRREALLAKQGRSAQFRSAAERDRWIGKEAEVISETVKIHERQIASVSDEILTAELRAADLAVIVEDLSLVESNLSSDLEKIDSSIYESRKRRDMLIEQRKELWRAENKLEGSMGTVKEEIRQCERNLMACMDKGAMQGLAAVRRIAAQQNITGFYGPLYELFDVDNVFRTATEAVAGASLFHVVVDNEDTASRLLEVMIREKAGRITLMPLTRLRHHGPSTLKFPANKDEAVPLIDQLRYHPRFEPAMRQVFGKTIICRDLQSGAATARAAGLDAITLTGDRADRKGALSGGFIDSKTSKLEMAARWKHWTSKLHENEGVLSEVKAKLIEAERQANRIVGQIEQLECRKAELQRSGTSELELRRRELTALKDLVLSKISTKASLEAQLSLLNAQIRSITSELGGPLSSKLSAEEQAELRTVIQEADKARQLVSGLAEETSKIATSVAALETELDMNLRRRRHELNVQLARVSTLSANRDLQLARHELESIEKSLSSVQDQLVRNAEGTAKLAVNIVNVQSAVEKARAQYDEAMRCGSRRNQSVEKYLSKRMSLVERRDALQRRIRELAVTTDATYERLRPEDGAHLLRRLHTINEELKSRFAHVNKKAHEQYANFHKQGDALRDRQRELETSSRAIDEFIQVLDRRKDEAIDRTFQQVAKGFSKVFQQLVPSGQAELIMLRSYPSAVDNSIPDTGLMQVDDSQHLPESLSVEYVGVAIRVSFNSKADEGQLMSQLSGGQKSLVALALIFSIQQCDPAPFYLFDEIDANLDAAHRSFVARIIAEMKEKAQFITTTFRPELLESAEMYSGVSFGGRVSRVEPITREQALQFVEHEPTMAP